MKNDEVKQNAVDNFLMSLDTNVPILMHFMNLDRDSALYGWNEQTRKVIRNGILDAYELQYGRK